MESLDVSGSAAMNVSVTESASVFRDGVRKSTNQIARVVKKRNDDMKEVFSASLKGSGELLQRVRSYNDHVSTTLQQTSCAVEEIKAALSEMESMPHILGMNGGDGVRGAVAVAPVDPDVLTARAVALAEQDD
uniref:Protein aardvark n=1 Tax=Lygus hesperus TaxID=30085 RepID=A0A0A9WVS2_LYGHE